MTLTRLHQMRLRTPKDIGAAIREARRALRLGQGDLAKRVGVSRLWINQVERGKPGAGVGLVLRALAAVGIELTTGSGHAARDTTGAVSTPDINAIIEAARGISKNKKKP